MDEHFEKYRLLVENTQKLSERRQAATQTYLTINTAIFTVLAFLIKDANFKGWWLVFAGLPLFGVGVAVCVIWFLIVQRFRTLDGWRYEQLREMDIQFPERFRIFTKEHNAYFRKSHFGFSILEMQLPWLFMLLYALYMVGITIAAANGYV